MYSMSMFLFDDDEALCLVWTMTHGGGAFRHGVGNILFLPRALRQHDSLPPPFGSTRLRRGVVSRLVVVGLQAALVKIVQAGDFLQHRLGEALTIVAPIDQQLVEQMV